MNIKNTLRALLNFLHLDLTKNLQYDRLTKKIMTQEITSNSNCIDIGCHKGEILDVILQLAPFGTHLAFEPIPNFYDALITKYNLKAIILPYALAASNGETTFNYVKNDPAYSGIKKKKYDIENPDIAVITVAQRTLDSVVDINTNIHFIKIDVEGGEFGVLQGAKQTISRCKPLIIFECGTGASDYYGTTGSDIYHYISIELGMKINTLKGFLRKDAALNLERFSNYFSTATEYYYVAYF